MDTYIYIYIHIYIYDLYTYILSFKRREAHRGAKGPEARGEGARIMDVRRTFMLKYFKINPNA